MVGVEWTYYNLLVTRLFKIKYKLEVIIIINEYYAQTK